MTPRFPIRGKMLEMILFEIERLCNKQYYLEVMYKTLFLISFYGFLRIGEATFGNHVLKAKNVHLGLNKNKIFLLLYTSKTHNKGSKLQEIKIVANDPNYWQHKKKRFFCPFKMTTTYLKLCGAYENDNDPFFVFRDNSPVRPHHARLMLKTAISKLNLDDTLYNFHSLRISMATEMTRLGCPIEVIK